MEKFWSSSAGTEAALNIRGDALNKILWKTESWAVQNGHWMLVAWHIFRIFLNYSYIIWGMKKINLWNAANLWSWIICEANNTYRYCLTAHWDNRDACNESTHHPHIHRCMLKEHHPTWATSKVFIFTSYEEVYFLIPFQNIKKLVLIFTASSKCCPKEKKRK